MRLFLVVLCSFVAAAVGEQTAGTWELGAPCDTQYSMTPDPTEYGLPFSGIEPPYHLIVMDHKGRRVKNYAPGQVYRIRLTGTVYFRAFLMQPRLTTKEGFIIGHLRGGEFVENEAQWTLHGVRFQACDKMNNSVTSTNFDKKHVVEVQWKVDADHGPIQFFVTIMQDAHAYWQAWKPKNGYLLPDKTAEKFKRPQIANQKPPQLVLSTPTPEDNKFEDVFVLGVPQQEQLGAVNEPAETDNDPEKSAFVEDLEKPTLETTTKWSTLPPVDEDNENVESLEKHTSSASVTTTRAFSSAAASLPAIESTAAPAAVQTTTAKLETLPTSTEQQQQLLEEEEDEELKDLASTRMGADDQPTSIVPFKLDEQANPTTADVPIDAKQPELEPEVKKDESEQRVVQRVLDPRTNRIVEFESKVTDYCADKPCQNGGTCRNLPQDDSYQCVCATQWTGTNCENRNHCHEHECVNGGICVNEEHGYRCECIGEWSGDLCHRKCPAYLCKNGGTCIINEDNNGELFGCVCPPGWTGNQCETDIDECASNPCLNGATCRNLQNEFECSCPAGWMGETCHRPCQDIYKSCDRWRRENRCHNMRHVTKFFDMNCGVTCKECTQVNETIRTFVPLPPVLEPFGPFIGLWHANFSENRRHPADFGDDVEGYEEFLKFSVAKVPMFGTPSINYTSVAMTHDDPDNRYHMQGFLTLNSRSAKGRPEQVAMLTTSNDGLTLIEEGTLEDRKVLKLHIKYAVKIPNSRSEINIQEASRTYALSGQWLQEIVTRKSADGRGTSRFTKYFRRVKKYDAY